MLRSTALTLAFAAFLALQLSAQQRDSQRPLRTMSEVVIQNDTLIVRGITYNTKTWGESDFMVGGVLAFSQLHGDVNNGSTFPGAARPWLWGVNFPLYYRMTTFDLPLFGETDLLLRGGFQFNRIQGDYPGYSVKNWLYNPHVGLQLDFLRFCGLDWAVQPIVYGGAGYLFHNPNVEGVTARYRAMKEYIQGTGTESATFLLGGGFQYMLNENLALFVAYDKTFTFTDALDHFVANRNDNYAGLSFGVRVSFGSSIVDTTAETFESRTYMPPGKVPDRCGATGLATANCSPWLSRSFEALTSAEKAEYTAKNGIDTDGDGLSDAQERFRYLTDPERVDTDGDGLNDMDEVVGVVDYEQLGALDVCGAPGMTMRRIQAILATNPKKRILITDPARADSDGDGIDDRTELCYTRTDPCKYDSDGDGLSDYVEAFVINTNPNLADTDADGLSDCEELLTTSTNPLLRDSNFDGISDGETARGGTKRDPRSAAGGCAEGRALDPVITFASGSWEIGESFQPAVLAVYDFLMRNPAARIEIAGFADTDPLYERDVQRSRRRNEALRNRNLELSERRARAAFNALIEHRISPRRLILRAGGELPGATEEEKSRNRKVVFTVAACK
jgi:outer membrane protein OmpA-like peptidoglycan-associated protein